MGGRDFLPFTRVSAPRMCAATVTDHSLDTGITCGKGQQEEVDRWLMKCMMYNDVKLATVDRGLLHFGSVYIG